MFARVPSKAHVCLQCQHRLALREASKSHKNNVQNTIRRRWQTASATADRQEEDDTDEQPIHYVTDTTKEHQSQVRFRHWQPPSTAELGVNVLGKPAEILVLPQGRTSKRRQRGTYHEPPEGDTAHDAVTLPVSQENVKPQLSVREALAEEARPALPSEVVENIDKLREEVNAYPEKLDAETLSKYQTALGSGFSKTQLERYVLSKGFNLGGYRIKGSGKQALVRTILQKVWGLDSTLFKEETLQPTSSSIHLAPETFELLRMDDSYAARLSRFTDTTMRYNPANARLWMRGKDVDIGKIKDIFDSFPRPVTKIIALTPTLDKALKAQAVDHPQMQGLMHKHSAILKRSKKSQHLQVWALSETNLQGFERELIDRQARVEQIAYHLPPLSLEALDRVATLPMSSTKSGNFYRYRSQISPDNEQTLSVARSLGDDQGKKTLDDLQEALQAATATRFNCDVLPVEGDMSKRFRSEYSVKLGQATFRQHNRDGGLVESPHQATSSVSAFQYETPFLPQFLARQSLLNTSTSIAAENATDAESEDLPFRITLRSASPTINPSIEIYASSQSDSPLSLRILAVTLVSTAISQTLLLPHTPVDLNIIREDKYTIFSHDLPVEQRHAPLLAQIAEQLITLDPEVVAKHPGKGTKNLYQHMNTLFDLDLSCLTSSNPATEADAPTQDQTQDKFKDPVQHDMQPLTNDKKKAKATAKVPKASTPTVRYALKRIESIDAAIYDLPFLSPHTSGAEPEGSQDASNPRTPRPMLEHLILTKLSSTRTQAQTEVVRLVERPMLHDVIDEAEANSDTSKVGSTSIDSDPERFHAFVRSACEVAMELDRFVRDRTKMMVQAHQRPEPVS